MTLHGANVWAQLCPGLSTSTFRLAPLLLILWHLTGAASIQIITTFAGSAAGVTGDNGDGGQATAALLQTPYGVAVNASGALYIVDPSTNRVRVVMPDGIISAVAGTGLAGYSGDSGAATRAQLNEPYAVAINIADGAVYIADSNSHIIRRVGLDGIITTVAGRPGMLGYSGDGSAATSALLHLPYGISVHPLTGDLLIADSANNAVRVVDIATGVISTVAGTGAPGYSGEGGPAVRAMLNYPCGVIVDASTGIMYVADTDNQRVRQISVNGIISNFAGNGLRTYAGDGGPALDASMWQPEGLALNAAGNVLYIADISSCEIRQVSAGIMSAVAGNGSRGFAGDGGDALQAELNFPNSIAVDANDDETMYIADSFNGVVRRVKTAASPPPVPPMSPPPPLLPPLVPAPEASLTSPPPRPPLVVPAPRAVSPLSAAPGRPHSSASHGALIGGAAGGVCIAAVLTLVVWWRFRGSEIGRSKDLDAKGATHLSLSDASNGGAQSGAALWSPNQIYLAGETPSGQAMVRRGEGGEDGFGPMIDRDEFGPLISPHLASASQLSTWGTTSGGGVGVSAMPKLAHMQPSWAPSSPTASPPSTWGPASANVQTGVKGALQTGWSSSQSANWDASHTSSSLGSSLLGGVNSALHSLDPTHALKGPPGLPATLEVAAGVLDHREQRSLKGRSSEARGGSLSPGHQPDASTRLQARMAGTDSPTGGSARKALASPTAKKMNVEGIQWTQGKLVDRGGSGRVYVGHDLSGALVAIKVQPLPARADALRLELLLGEVTALQSLKHRNVVEYFGSAMDEQNLYIFMAYEPQSLAMLLKDGLDEVVVRKFTRQILQGLEYIHSVGVAHRDIKAANLLVDRDGVIKLTDFGSAKMHRSAEHDSNIKISSIAGTPHWMSPEICLAAMGQGGGYSGTKADVWSLGVTVVEMMMGGHPWCKMEGLKAIWTVVHGEDGMPRPAHASSMAMDFMDQCMERDPNKRATIAQLLLHPFVTMPDIATTGVVRRPLPRFAVPHFAEQSLARSHLSSPTGSIPSPRLPSSMSGFAVSATPVDGTTLSSSSAGTTAVVEGVSAHVAARIPFAKGSSPTTQAIGLSSAPKRSVSAPALVVSDSNSRGSGASVSTQNLILAASAQAVAPAVAPTSATSSSQLPAPRHPLGGLSTLLSGISATEYELQYSAAGLASPAILGGWEGRGTDGHGVPLPKT